MAIEDSGLGVVYGTGDFYDHILNDMFLPAVADTVINPNELVRLLPRDKTRVQGKNVVYPVHKGRNLGGNAIGAFGDLPDPGAQGYDGYSFPIRHIYHRVLFDGITKDASRSDVASWLRVVESEMTGAATDMARRRNRIFNNDGSGRLCMVNGAVTAGTSITVDNHDGIESGTAALMADFPATTHIHEGMRVAFFTSAGVFEAVAKVTSITSGTVFVVDRAVTLTTDSWVVEVSQDTNPTTADSAFQNEPMGLAGIFSDADPSDGVTGFQGILSSNTWHQANIAGSGGGLRDISEWILQAAYSDAIRLGEANINCLFGSFGIVNSYISLLINDKRFATTTLSGGSTAVTFNGLPFVADRDAWTNRVYMMDTSNMRVYVMSDPEWMDYDGGRFHRLENKDAFQATLYCREQLGVDVRDKCTLIVELNEDEIV